MTSLAQAFPLTEFRHANRQGASAPVEELLLVRLRRREGAAVTELCEIHGPPIRRLAFAMVGDANTAEDIAQEVLVLAWEKAAKAAPGTRLGAWLAGIAVNLCRQELRRVVRRSRREKRAAKPEASPAEIEPSESRHSIVVAALGSLAQAERELVAMRYLDGLSVAEVADILGVPEGTVKSRTHAAVERLRQIVARMETEA